MKFKHKHIKDITAFLFLSILGILFISTSCLAEVSCVSSISYKWKSEAGDEIEVPWVTLNEAGADEAAVKPKLLERISLEKKRAYDGCGREHENVSGCIASRASNNSAALQTLSFSARKSLEESIKADCGKGNGTCSGVSATEVQCTEIKVVEKEETEGEGKGKEGDKKEDAKGKGKKK